MLAEFKKNLEHGTSEVNIRSPRTPLPSQLANAPKNMIENDLLFDGAVHLLERLTQENRLDMGFKKEALLALRKTAIYSSDTAVGIARLFDILDEDFMKRLPALEPEPGFILKLQKSTNSFEHTKKDFQQAIENLRDRIDSLQKGQSFGERGSWRELMSAASRHEKTQKRFSQATNELISLAKQVVVTRGGSLKIRHSVYAFLDKRKSEEEGYGLYTYVLFTTPGPRNDTFAKALITSTTTSGETKLEFRRYLNIFYLLALDRIDAQSRVSIHSQSLDTLGSGSGNSVYDFSFARDVMLRVCENPATFQPDFCETNWRGPILVTSAKPLRNLKTIPSPILVVDLSDVKEQAFGEFIHAVKNQVMSPDFTDQRKIQTLRLRLILNIILTGAEVVQPILEGVESLIHMVS